jgi:hypothetical protein
VDTAAGLAVRYTMTDAGAEAAIRELMKPFALTYSISQRIAP